jgi:hypothetical protein
VVSRHFDQGWSLLCNGVVLFEDTGELLPDRKIIPPRRPSVPHAPTPSQAMRHALAPPAAA